MALATQKIPGPDHPITIERNRGRVVVTVNGRVVADSRSALTLREASYPPVHYIPRSDIDMSLFERTDHTTHCPYKGHASYFSVSTDGSRSHNAGWSYEDPYEAVSEIKEHIAFYPDRIDGLEVHE